MSSNIIKINGSDKLTLYLFDGFTAMGDMAGRGLIAIRMVPYTNKK